MADEQTPKWRGVKVVGGDLRISDLKITFDDDGNITTGPVRTQIRTDLWPFWLEDAVEAAATACSLADQIPALDALLDTDVPKEPINAEIDRLLFRELRASMRAITACAFAIDAFYAMVKERCGPHPHHSVWRKNRTARERQITETLRHHLGIEPEGTRQVKSAVSQLFRFRDWAVHMAADFRDPVYRDDIHCTVDWRLAAFRRDNAVTSVAMTVALFDGLASILDRGGDELKQCQKLACELMDDIFRAYEQVDGLPSLQRSQHPVGETASTESA
jgi:hypothetical protein